MMTQQELKQVCKDLQSNCDKVAQNVSYIHKFFVPWNWNEELCIARSKKLREQCNNAQGAITRMKYDLQYVCHKVIGLHWDLTNYAPGARDLDTVEIVAAEALDIARDVKYNAYTSLLRHITAIVKIMDKGISAKDQQHINTIDHTLLGIAEFLNKHFIPTIEAISKKIESQMEDAA